MILQNIIVKYANRCRDVMPAAANHAAAGPMLSVVLFIGYLNLPPIGLNNPRPNALHLHQIIN